MVENEAAAPTPPAGVAVDDSGGNPDDSKREELDAKRRQEDIEKHFKAQIEQSERSTQSRKFAWKRNVELRQGNPLGAYGSVVQGLDDDYQSEINPDWYLTKTKIAALFSQVPTVQISHAHKQFSPAIGPFAKSLNYELGDKRCATAACMAESMADLVNAAGFCAAEVGYAARMTEKEVPAIDVSTLTPEQMALLEQTGGVPMKKVTVVADYRFFTNRISPVNVLKPEAFVGSDFDQAPWLGLKFSTSKVEAKAEWSLTDEQCEQLHSDETPNAENDLKTNREGVTSLDMKTVRGKRIYYRRYRVDPDCLSFSEIWEIVWLDGIQEPVSHKQWSGQKTDPQTGRLVGVTAFPIRIGTTVYISDNSIPPSDTQAGRPQVNDMRRSRSQMFQNREFSKPLRWFNTDKTDPMMHDLIMKGQLQGMIPVQGDGTKLIGEVARASYPAEDLSFDNKTEADLGKMWALGPNQMGQLASHEVTKGEANLAQQGFNTVMGSERNSVSKYFLGIVEVLAGLMALYSDFPNLMPDERQALLSVWNAKGMPPDIAFTILPDSQITLDTQTQIARKERFLNMAAKSGYINIKQVITDLAELYGQNPVDYVVDPQPRPQKPATVSFNFKGREDLQNPAVVAILMENGQFPPPEKIEEARKLLERLGMAEPIAPPQQPPPGANPLQGQPLPPGADHEPQWSLANTVAKRNRDIGGE